MAARGSSIKQVFISHATAADGKFAQRLAGDLRRLGVPVWIAPDSIPEGEPWVDAIERGLSESSHIVIVLTPAALKSPWVKKETNAAMDLESRGRVHVIPLDVEPCEAPLLLRGYQMVRFRRGYDAGLSRLARVLGLSVTPAEPGPAPRRAFEPELILIPAGEFLMGSDPKKDKDARDREQPQHRLSLPEYYMAKTPVTNAQYLAFVQATDHGKPEHWEKGKPPKGKEDHPVAYVSWHDAMAYCNWLAEVTGKAYRLPSEAEWEKAARGTDGRVYPWGDDPPDERRCNFDYNVKDTTPVGQYSPRGDSPYGCVDMAGNVWEWTLSLWGKDLEKPDFKYPYDPADGREDSEAGDNVPRVLRGGSWHDFRRVARCAFRLRHLPDFFFNLDVGFRLVVSLALPSSDS